MDLDEIQSLWNEDSKLDADNLHTESTNIPALHAKYYRILNKFRYFALRNDPYQRGNYRQELDSFPTVSSAKTS